LWRDRYKQPKVEVNNEIQPNLSGNADTFWASASLSFELFPEKTINQESAAEKEITDKSKIMIMMRKLLLKSHQ
jgi:hypothetical protein